MPLDISDNRDKVIHTNVIHVKYFTGHFIFMLSMPVAPVTQISSFNDLSAYDYSVPFPYSMPDQISSLN